MSDTIAAIATGSVLSAIGIIRLSGDAAIEIADRVFTPANGGKMSESANRMLTLGNLRDAGGSVIDHCLCTVSRAPNSYTGEHTAELQCHGSPTVLRLAMESLFAAGARQALAGEFTKRAFLNGRLDLVGAEAVIDLIDSETAAAARNAAAQLGGAISGKIEQISSSLIDILAHYCAVLDYPDEDIEPFELASYEGTLSLAGDELTRLLSTLERGRIMRDGAPAAILGRPNVGKSSLLNALLGFNRAIVTDTPGTTRDTIEEKCELGGILLRLIDTAGLRETGNNIEAEGVDRARIASRSSAVILAVFDGSAPLQKDDFETISLAKASGKRIAVLNKSDLPPGLDPCELRPSFDYICNVSAQTGEGLDGLGEAMRELFPIPPSPDGEIITNARQADAISRCLESIRAALEAMAALTMPDAVLTELEAALAALGELTGKTVREDVTERIFSRFCVGK